MNTPATGIPSLVADRFDSDREDTDPRITLDRLQIEEHGKRLGEIQTTQDKLFSLVRKIARKMGVVEE